MPDQQNNKLIALNSLVYDITLLNERIQCERETKVLNLLAQNMAAMAANLRIYAISLSQED